MKKGDIVLNKFGGLRENRILCYIGDGDFLYYFKDGFHKGRWNTKDKYHDGTPNLELIGHSDFFEVLKKDLRKYQDTQKEYKTYFEILGDKE